MWYISYFQILKYGGLFLFGLLSITELCCISVTTYKYFCTLIFRPWQNIQHSTSSNDSVIKYHFFFLIIHFFLPCTCRFFERLDWKVSVATLEELGCSRSLVSSDEDSIISSVISTEVLPPATSIPTSNFVAPTSFRAANLFWTEIITSSRLQIKDSLTFNILNYEKELLQSSRMRNKVTQDT